MITGDLFLNSPENNIPISPKQFSLVKIKAIDACNLNTQWHSRLPVIDWSNVVRTGDYICFGFVFEFSYYAVGIWSGAVAANRFKNGHEILELRRLAISELCPKNTATRMISLMIKEIKINFPHIKRLISYQDTDVHTGTIYKASNWKNTAESQGGSWNTKTRKRNTDQTIAKKIRWEYML